jgi:hypothetical protein
MLYIISKASISLKSAVLCADFLRNWIGNQDDDFQVMYWLSVQKGWLESNCFWSFFKLLRLELFLWQTHQVEFYVLLHLEQAFYNLSVLHFERCSGKSLSNLQIELCFASLTWAWVSFLMLSCLLWCKGTLLLTQPWNRRLIRASSDVCVCARARVVQ